MLPKGPVGSMAARSLPFSFLDKGRSAIYEGDALLAVGIPLEGLDTIALKNINQGIITEGCRVDHLAHGVESLCKKF